MSGRAAVGFAIFCIAPWRAGWARVQVEEPAPAAPHHEVCFAVTRRLEVRAHGDGLGVARAANAAVGRYQPPHSRAPSGRTVRPAFAGGDFHSDRLACPALHPAPLQQQRLPCFACNTIPHVHRWARPVQCAQRCSPCLVPPPRMTSGSTRTAPDSVAHCSRRPPRNRQYLHEGPIAQYCAWATVGAPGGAVACWRSRHLARSAAWRGLAYGSGGGYD
jgi:hypothetical protein